jgi:hypothetical protein
MWLTIGFKLPRRNRPLASQAVVVASMQIPYASKIESQIKYVEWLKGSIPWLILET